MIKKIQTYIIYFSHFKALFDFESYIYIYIYNLVFFPYNIL
jgi:hypothetical protein